MTLFELYAERDRLRAVRARLDAEYEALVAPSAENARAIIEQLQKSPGRPSAGNPAAFPLEHTTPEDLPEFFERLAE